MDEQIDYGVNVVVLVGRVTGDAVQIKRGETYVTEFRVRTGNEGFTLAAPVVAHDEDWGDPSTAKACLHTIKKGDEVMVLGRVERRFDKKSGQTLARTEVRATRIIQRGSAEGSASTNMHETSVILEAVMRGLAKAYGREKELTG